jgi:phage gpG-like protein
MEFFHKMNIKYLKRFTSKMNLFTSQIDHDIRIDSTTKTKERRKSMMDEFKQDNINVGLINELAESIASTSSDEESSDSGINKEYHTIDKTGTIETAVITNSPFMKDTETDDETVHEELNVNIRKRTSINCPHGDKICNCPEKEQSYTNVEENVKSVASQLLAGVEDNLKNPLDDYSDHDKIIIDNQNNIDTSRQSGETKEDDETKEDGETKEDDETKENCETNEPEEPEEPEEGVTFELEEKQ